MVSLPKEAIIITRKCPRRKINIRIKIAVNSLLFFRGIVKNLFKSSFERSLHDEIELILSVL